jgi:hypothetical protein
MIPARLMTSDIVLERRTETGRDSYNHPTYTTTKETVKGYYQARRSNTVVSGGEVLKTDDSVILQPGTNVTGLAFVTAGGIRFEVDGEPMPHWNPLKTAVQYIRVDLRRGVN